MDIGQQNCKIKEVKLGFDFEYNPVCLIATSSMLISEYYLDVCSQEVLLTQCVGAKCTQPGCRSLALQQRPGIWALKGDRVRGLHVRIGNFASLRIEREENEHKLVWGIYLQECHSRNVSVIHDSTQSVLSPKLITNNPFSSSTKTSPPVLFAKSTPVPILRLIPKPVEAAWERGG